MRSCDGSIARCRRDFAGRLYEFPQQLLQNSGTALDADAHSNPRAPDPIGGNLLNARQRADCWLPFADG